MIISNFDANKRVLPIFQPLSFIDQTQVERVTNIALPFFSLYRPTAIASTIGLGSYKTWKCITELKGSLQRKEWSSSCAKMLELSFVVSSVALIILIPTVGSLLIYGEHLIVDIYGLALAINRRDYREMAVKCLSTTHTLIYLASVLYATPEAILVSLLSQAILELYQARNEFKQGRILEGIAKIVMASIRTYQAVPHAQALQRKWSRTVMTEKELQDILSEIQALREQHEGSENDQEMPSVTKVAHKIRTTITPYLIENKSYKGNYLSEQTFSDIHFKNCDFNTTYAKKCQFTDIKFEKCDMDNFTSINSVFTRVLFDNTKISQSAFYASDFNFATFKACNLTASSFHRSRMNQVSIENCKLLETSFLGAKVESNSSIKNCDLTDTLLFDAKQKLHLVQCTPNKITRSVVALGWNFAANGSYAVKINKVLTHQKGGIRVLFDYAPDDIDTSKLNNEVSSLLNNIKQHPSANMLSIPKEILNRASLNGEIQKLKNKADELCRNVHAVILPGGENVEPEFYQPYGGYYSTYLRSIMEFSVIDKAYEKQLPLMGICRGSQIVNVFRGGTLKDVWGHFGDTHILYTNPYDASPAAQVLKSIVGSKFKGKSMHAQTSDKIGKGLKCVLKHVDSAEAVISDDGKVVLTQFHPEAYIDGDDLSPEMKVNENFFKHLIAKADQKRLTPAATLG